MIWDKKSYVEIVMTHQWRGRVLGLEEEILELQISMNDALKIDVDSKHEKHLDSNRTVQHSNKCYSEWRE